MVPGPTYKASEKHIALLGLKNKMPQLNKDNKP